MRRATNPSVMFVLIIVVTVAVDKDRAVLGVDLVFSGGFHTDIGGV